MGEVAGVRKDSPANQPLSGSETCLYYFCNGFFGLLFCPLWIFCCFGAFVLQPMQAKILMVYGKVVGVKNTAGCHWVPPCLVDKEHVDLRVTTIKMPTSSIPDQTGSPMNVSTLITYVIKDPVAAVFNVEYLPEFISNSALEVVKTVCNKFKYRDNDPSQPSLL